MIVPPDRELAVFSAARQLPSEQRAAYLLEACAGDAALRERVERLLRAGEKAGGFLENPPAFPQSPDRTIRVIEVSSEKPGDRISRYKLLQQIGEGGCGVVYMAEQEEPVRRRVALKVIKLGMDTKSVIARFEAERQALALMEHPNIARVFDAGATETGRPYFVMELVRGVKITDYCDQNNLSTRERLDLFIQVCQAIQHAHQKGIIHRDIKPSNILVTINDGVAVPTVIDFGIAKATQGRLTDKTLFTAFEQFMGTPAYMSPEQAAMTSLDVDTRSDIYSLGVLLYELLTGSTPFDAGALFQSGLDEIRRVIREEEPARPSTKLSTMEAGALTTAAKRRGAEPPKLIHLVRGDLDWIVMKALEKNRARRYETANGMAMDIQRHLNNEPISARPPSNLYRFQKLVQRNKFAFFSTAAVAVALVLGITVSAWQAVRATRAEKEQRLLREEAQDQEAKAKTEAAKSRQVAGFLQDMIQGIGPEVAKGEDTKMLRAIVDKTVNRIGTELAGQPEVEAEMRSTLGRVYCDLGQFSKAEEMQTNALMLVQKYYGGESTNAASVLQQLADTIWERGDYPRAEALGQQAFTLWQKTVGMNDSRTALTLNDIGLTRWNRGDLTGAESYIRQALNIRKGLSGEHRIEISESFNNLGLILRERGSLAEAEAAQRQALALKKSADPEGNLLEANYLNNLANVLQDRGDFAGAESAYRDALPIVTKFLPEGHPHVALVRSHLSTVIRRQGALSGDVSLFREALQLNPLDQLSADGLACSLADASLTPLGSDPRSDSTVWRYSSESPAPNWAAPEFPAGTWSPTSNLLGSLTYASRSDRAVPGRTNLWLRREFEMTDPPTGKLVLRINRNQDAEVYLNGVLVAPVADWSDVSVVIPCSVTGQAELKPGRNVLAFHCQDADGGARLGVGVYVTTDETLGRKGLIGEFGQMITNEPGRAELYAGRASALARLGRWNEAAADLVKAVEIKPPAVMALRQLAPLLVETGDLIGYQRNRRNALERFAKPGDPNIAGQVADLSLLIPAEEPDTEQAEKLADMAAAADYPDWNLAGRQFTKGLAEYRLGHFAGAIDWTGKALTTGARQDLPGWSHERERNRDAAAYLIQAMAHQQLNQIIEAQAALANGMHIIKTQFPSAESGDLGREWQDVLVAGILSREAQTLINKSVLKNTL